MIEPGSRAGLAALMLALGLLAVPPAAWADDLPLAQADEAGTTSDGGGVLSKLRKLTAEPEPEFLPVDKAFKVSVQARDAHTLVAEFVPAKGYYLYRDKLGVAARTGSGVTVEAVQLPRGELKSDPNFGDTEVFHAPVQAIATLKRKSPGAQHISVEASFQGCAEAGLCYPPERKKFNVVLAAYDVARPGDAGAGQPRAVPSPPATPVAAIQSPAAEPSGGTTAAPPMPPVASAAPVDESSQAAQLLRGGSFWGVVAGFFGLGILLSFTPCVLPMVPILSGIIVGQGQRMSRAHALLLTAVYVLGMAVTYAAAGVAAGLSGTLLATTLQNPWVLGGFAALFVVLALSMFGVYELQLPAALQSRLSGASNQMRSGTFWGVLAMGALSALIVGPCVAAPLAGALLYINQTRDAVLGGTGLFAMALGMGVPLMAVGASAGALLPRVGAWMQTVKNFFGVVLLGVAIWIVAPIIPAVAQMLLWAVLLICAAIYLHAIDPLPHHASGYRKLWKGVGVIALLLGVALLIGALSGGRDVLQPLAGLRAAGGAAEPGQAGPRFIKIASVADLEDKIAQAGGRAVMLDFYADWCISCKEMERFTFTDPEVRARMERMLLLKADVTANSADDKALLQRFAVYGPPATIFFDPAGRQLAYRVIGFQPARQFATSLDAAMQPAS